MLYSKLYLPHPQKGEKIELLLRRHPFVLGWQFIVYAILLVVPLAFRWFFSTNFPAIWTHPMLEPLFLLGGSIYIMFIVLFFYTSFLDYWLDVWIVTNERIISIEQKGLFSRTFSEQQLYRLQDVSSNVHGFFPTIFRYGDVLVQSAGTVQNTLLEQIPHSDVVARRIMDLLETSRRHHEEHVIEEMKG